MRIAGAALALLLASACGPSELRVTMNSDNNSGQVGFAVIERLGDRGLRVTVETTVPSTGTAKQSAHIHKDNCGEIGDVVVGLNALESLGNMRFGSTTETEVLTFDDLKQGNYCINAHDATDPTVYVSCGEIPKP